MKIRFWMSLVIMFLVLTACAPVMAAPTETPTQTTPAENTSSPIIIQSPTEEPTATFTPEATPTTEPLTLEQQLTEYLKTNVAQKSIDQFVNTFQLDAETTELVRNNLTINEITAKDGQQYEIALASVPQENIPSENQKYADLYQNIPLMIAEKNSNGEWEWDEATLGKIAAKQGMLVGSNYRSEESTESKITLEQFNLSFIDGNASKLRNIHPGKDIFSINGLIAEIKNASLTGNPIIVHNLILGEKLDDKRVTWDDKMTKEEIIQEAVVEHLTKIVGAEGIKGNVFAYTFNEPGSAEDKLWQANPDYLRIAAETIRIYDPNAKIILNIPENFNLNAKYGDNNPKLTSRLAIELYEVGLIDVVGIQGHIFGATPPTDQQIEAAFNRFKTPVGVQIPIWITELDVNMKGVNDPSFQKQAIIIEKVVKKIIELGCRVINNWEIGDKNSWLEEPPFKGRSSPDANGTLFDDNLQPKPSYFTFLRALFQANSND